MTSLQEALDEVRARLLAPGLVRAVARGSSRGGSPRMTSATLRPVRLKSGDRLQLVTDDGQRPTMVNLPLGASAELDALLTEPFVSWVVESSVGTLRMQATRKGAILHRSPPGPIGGSPARAASHHAVSRDGADAPDGSAHDWAASHDRVAQHLLDPGDPLFDVIGGNAAKRRQVDAFLRQLPSTLDGPLHVVDLGCGNAYLTFAAYRYLSGLGLDVHLTGVDVREDQRERNIALAERLGWADRVRFVAAEISTARLDQPDLVLALHACDTATDDALARAVRWQARWILAAPCCHKDVSRQLRQHPSNLLTQHGILRERFADVLTDAVRAALLREQGYHVDVVEFIDSAHTPRNSLIRAGHTGAPNRDPALAALLSGWQVTPALASLLGAE